MTRRVRYEVLPTAKADRRADPELKRWTVTRESERISTHERQGEAINVAVHAAHGAYKQRGQLAQVIIKRANGTIKDERTYGDDPPEIPG